MKKNKFLRLASVMLMLCLITTCAISGTFAKYTTSGTATDVARVAKWGIGVTVTGAEAFATSYTNVTSNTELNTNLDGNDGTDSDDLLAPGTSGTLTEVTISGQPEVTTDVTVTVNLNLGANWTVNSAVYCPVEFTVGTVKYVVGTGEDTSTLKHCATTAALELAVEKAIIDGVLGNVEDANVTSGSSSRTRQFTPNNNFGDNTVDVSVGWNWAFTGNDNAKDTVLGNTIGDGNADNDPTIAFTISVTVDQVD